MIPSTLSAIRSALPRHHVLPQQGDEGPGAAGGYFTAVLISRLSVYLDSFESAEPFPGSKMGRGLQVVDCHVGKARIRLMNTHLESTKV